MIDENLIFITLITVFAIFMISRQPKLVATILAVGILYFMYKSRFTNPKEIISYFKNIITEGFEPCSSSNLGYCGGDDYRSNLTFLPDIMRAGLPTNDPERSLIKPADYGIDKRLKMGPEEITIDKMVASVPSLVDYKSYLENVIKFVLSIKTDDKIQKDFLAKKLRHRMINIFYNAYNTVNEKKYPISPYNRLLFSQREFYNTLDILTMLGLDDYDNNEVSKLQKEFKEINDKVNQFVIDKVNNITPNDYNITTSFLPRLDDPLPINGFD